MKKSWLMVSRWAGSKMEEQFCWDKIKTVSTAGRQAQRLAELYERELNGGQTHDEKWESGDFSATFTVHAIPYSAAREYINFNKWEDAAEFAGKEQT